MQATNLIRICINMGVIYEETEQIYIYHPVMYVN